MERPHATHAARQILSASDGAARNDAFAIWYPLLLVCAGLAGLLFTRPWVLMIEVVTGSGIACAGLVALCSGRAKLRVSRLLGAGLLQGYAVGALPDAFGSIVSGDPNSVLYGPDVHLYALALAQIFFGVALLWVAGEFTLPFLRLPNLTPTIIRNLKRLAWIGTALLVFGLATGKIGYMGSSTTGGGETPTGHISLFVSIAGWATAPTIGATATILAAAKIREQKFLYGLALVLQMVCVTPTGRRNFLYDLLLAFTVYCLWKPSFSRSGWKVTAAILSSILLVSVAWTAFLLMRIASYSYEQGQAMPLGELTGRAWALYNSGSSKDLASAWSDSGLEARADVLDYDMLLLAHTSSGHLAYGGNAWNEFQWVIPRALWPNKQLIAEEDYASELYNTFIPDSANSIFTAATIDFGFYGGFFYPVLLCLALVITLAVCRLLFPPAVYYFCACAVLLACLQTEWGLSSYLTGIRDTFIFGVFFSAVLLSPSLLQPRIKYAERHGY